MDAGVGGGGTLVDKPLIKVREGNCTTILHLRARVMFHMGTQELADFVLDLGVLEMETGVEGGAYGDGKCGPT
jgi:hypothetical protein